MILPFPFDENEQNPVQNQHGGYGDIVVQICIQQKMRMAKKACIAQLETFSYQFNPTNN